jgi:membrane associated rhomboid family serine protease
MAYRSGVSFGFGLTPWVQRLLIANTLVFLVTYTEPTIANYLAFVPQAILFQPWTLLTYMFVHGNFMHLLFNMLGLFFFGPPLEARWGSREFIKFYLICGIGGAILSFLFVSSSIVGASAAVYGVMLAFAMNWPDTPIYIWGIFPVPAKILVGIMAVFSLFSAFGGGGRYDGVAHFAHLGGFVAAWAYLKWDRKRRGSGMQKFRKMMTKRRLTVVPGGKEPSTAVPSRSEPRAAPDDVLLDQLDRVLDKINSSGMSSLTAEERKLLEDVSNRYRQN